MSLFVSFPLEIVDCQGPDFIWMISAYNSTRPQKAVSKHLSDWIHFTVVKNKV